MDRTDELNGLLEASKLLKEKRIALVSEPDALYAIVSHAYNAVDERLAKMLRGDDLA